MLDHNRPIVYKNKKTRLRSFAARPTCIDVSDIIILSCKIQVGPSVCLSLSYKVRASSVLKVNPLGLNPHQGRRSSKRYDCSLFSILAAEGENEWGEKNVGGTTKKCDYFIWT